MHHGDETEHEQDESTAAEEPKTDREDGGPTSDDSVDEEATGSGTGTKQSPFEPHE